MATSPLNFVTSTCSLTVGVVLILAAVAKLRASRADLEASGLQNALPFWLSRSVASLLPWVELVAGCACLINMGWSWLGAFVAGMILMFTLSFTASILRGTPIRCGCFGEGKDEEIPPSLFLFRNIGLLGLALLSMGADVTVLLPLEWAAAAFVVTILFLSYSVFSTHVYVRNLAR